MRPLARLGNAKIFRWASLGTALTMALGPSCSDPAESEPDRAVTADVTAVNVSGGPGAYTFSVTVSSPDTGCDQYADWWEVITTDGELVYRRILAHSHVNEQPFTRSGGPVELQETTQAIVRAHMNDAGYGGVAFSGSPAPGFGPDPSVTSSFAPELAEVAPQPDSCAF